MNDILLVIALHSSDKTAINILLTNKKLYGYFHSVFSKRYPHLTNFRRQNEGLQSLYLRMLKYIKLLREEFRFVYKSEDQKNPILTYGFKKYERRDENMNLLLVGASRKGDLEIVRTCLEVETNIDARDYALRKASMAGHLPVVKYLLEAGAHIHTDGNWCLKWSAWNGHLHVVKYLVEAGADIHAEDDYTLKKASMAGHLSIVKYLVERGANIGAGDNEALEWASERGHLPVVQYLVERGANFHAWRNWDLSCKCGNVKKVIKYLRSLESKYE